MRLVFIFDFDKNNLFTYNEQCSALNKYRAVSSSFRERTRSRDITPEVKSGLAMSAKS